MAIVDVDLWQWRLQLPEGVGGLPDEWLSDDERARAERFVSPADREGYFAARRGLRAILAAYVGQEPSTLRFAYGAAGKPSLVSSGSGPRFNLSHSGDRAVLAVTSRLEIGVDIERERPIKDDLARRYFSPQECAAIAALPAADRTSGFFRCWSRKEAVVKALGVGLNRPLASFDVSVAQEPWPKVTRMHGASIADVERWQIASLELATGYAGAIALQVDTMGDRMNVTFRDWLPDTVG